MGVADHSGWAVLMTVARDGTLIDRRRVVLVEDDLPTMPHHHEGQALPIEEAVALVERVRCRAERNASARLRALAAEVPIEIGGIALRMCPPLPDTVAERITSYRAMCFADGVMYRQTLARSATERGWVVHWYDAARVLAKAARDLQRDDRDDLFAATRREIGPPWQKDHRIAMAAAIAAANARP